MLTEIQSRVRELTFTGLKCCIHQDGWFIIKRVLFHRMRSSDLISTRGGVELSGYTIAVFCWGQPASHPRVYIAWPAKKQTNKNKRKQKNNLTWRSVIMPFPYLISGTGQGRTDSPRRLSSNAKNVANREYFHSCHIVEYSAWYKENGIYFYTLTLIFFFFIYSRALLFQVVSHVSLHKTSLAI